MEKKIKLIVYHADEDDPKKCTAKKMARFGFVTLEKRLSRLPKNAIVLNPFAKKSLSCEDREVVKKYGLVALDCSWKTAEHVFQKIKNTGTSRALPFVIAVNPVNFGKPFQLTTLEAFAASLYILGEETTARELLNLYKWGPYFLQLNREPLDEYRMAKTSADVIEIMKKYI